MEYPLYSAVLAQLDKTRGDWPSVSRGSGVPLPTVRKIGQRVATNPRICTIEQLAAFFKISYQPAGDVDAAALAGSVPMLQLDSPE